MQKIASGSIILSNCFPGIKWSWYENKTARRVSCEYESWQQTCNFCDSKYAKVAEQRFEKAEDVVEKTQE